MFSQRKQVQICVSQSYSCSEELHRCPQPPCSDQSYLSVWQIWVNELISHTRTHLCHHHPSTLTSPWSLRSVWFMHTRCTGWKGFCDLYTSSELALRSSLSQINVINNKQTAGYFLISLKSLCKNTSSVRVILPTTMTVDVSTKEKKNQNQSLIQFCSSKEQLLDLIKYRICYLVKCI